MKLISLNTWGGRAGHKEFLDFIKKHKDSTDIFCLQEVWEVKDDKGREELELYKKLTDHPPIMSDLLSQVSIILPGYESFFRPHVGNHFGLAMFLKRDMKITEEGDIFVYENKFSYLPDDVGKHSRNIQHANMETQNGIITIVNFHGLWNGKGKTDTEDRLLQSENILNFLKKINNPFILCGDFNLLPDTESLKKFEQFGLRNLIKENGITSTRSSLYTKEHRYADYAFVSEGIEVNDFKVLPDEISDHLALYIEFN